MKNFEFLKKGRKIVFSLALFLLVFAVASVVKIHAAGNVTGYLWGGSEDANIAGVRGDTNSNCLKRGSLGYAPGICIDGNETGIGWIKMNGVATDPAHSPYGVSIEGSGPSGDLIGYGWSETLGWIDFNPDADCVSGTPGAGQYQSSNCSPPAGSECGSGGVSRNTGNHLDGCARVVSVAQAGANAGGWDGWISMRNTSPPGASYEVSTDLMVGNDSGSGTYAWSGESLASAPNIANGLGSIDFSRASFGPTSPASCVLEFIEPPSKTITLSTGLPGTAKLRATGDCQTITLSYDDAYVTVSSAPLTSFENKTETINLVAKDKPVSPTDIVAKSSAPGNPSATLGLYINSSVVTPCSCGSADGKRYCSGEPPADADKCKSGSLTNLPNNEKSYNWTCGSCSCSASKICGWIETQP